MVHFIGFSKHYGLLFVRLYDDNDGSVRDCDPVQVHRTLGLHGIQIRNLTFAQDGKLIGSCGHLSRYGVVDYDNGTVKNKLVVVYKSRGAYYLCDIFGKVGVYSELEAIVLDQAVGIANAKLVTKNGASHLYAISGHFNTGNTYSEQIEAKLEQYNSMASDNRLGKSNMNKLRNAEDEYEARRQALRNAERKRLLDVQDYIFMRPVTKNINSIEKSTDKAHVDRKLRALKAKHDKIVKYAKYFLKNGIITKTEYSSLIERAKALNNAIREIVDAYKYNDEIQSYEVDTHIVLAERRANLLWEDIMSIHSRYLEVK